MWRIGLFLVAIGLFFAWVGHSYFVALAKTWDVLPDMLAALSDSVLIAGVLLLLVDPFLKGRLIHQLSKSVSLHMIGFDHEPQLKAKIQQAIYRTVLYWRNCEMDWSIEPAGADKVVVTLITRWEIVNESMEPQEYTPSWIFTDGDEPGDCEFTAIVGDGEQTPVVSKPTKSDSGRVEAKGNKAVIQPRQRGISYHFASRCSFKAPKNYFHPIYLGQPTVGVRIFITAPPGWPVWIVGLDSKTDESKQTAVTWSCTGILMPSDHLEIHWRGQNVLPAVAKQRRAAV